MKKMRTCDIVGLVLILLLGSAYVFFATNCFITIIFNYEANWNFPYTFGIIPHLIFAIELVAFLVFAMRYIRMDPMYRKHHVKVYMWQFIAYSLVGLILTILGGTLSYDFLINNPYPGVLIVCLIMNVLIGGFAAYVLIKLRKDGKEEKKLEYKFTHILFTIGASLITFFALNRFGAFLWGFFYMDYSHFWFTLPFYLSLLVPLTAVIVLELPIMGYKGEHFKRNQIITWSIILVFALATGLYTIIVGCENPLLISLISAAMPIERIATKPFDAIFLYGINFLLPLGKLIYLILKKDKQ